jgi:hypothetical protein
MASDSADYTSLHDFYEKTFSSFVEINALFKQNPDQESAKIKDPEIKTELLFTVYDQLNDLV